MEIYTSLATMGDPIGWSNVFDASRASIHNACSFIEEDCIKYTPVASKVFNAYRMIQPNDVKVVILGEAPNPCAGYSDGLSFSCSTGVTSMTMTNIYKELTSCIPGFVVPTNGDVSNWCKQGVMLLNVSLVERIGHPGYKSRIWMPLIKATIDRLNISGKVIWILWGTIAQSIGKIIGTGSIKLEAPSPMPTSAWRGFHGCKHFSTVNTILTKQGKTLISWSLTDIEPTVDDSAVNADEVLA